MLQPLINPMTKQNDSEVLGLHSVTLLEKAFVHCDVACIGLSRTK